MTNIEPGMTKRAIKQELGKPTRKITLKQFLRGYSAGSFGSGISGGHEAWLYVNVPEEGHDTYIMFVGGSVSEVRVEERR